jgi:hypothetical protein
MCVCVCVCVCMYARGFRLERTSARMPPPHPTSTMRRPLRASRASTLGCPARRALFRCCAIIDWLHGVWWWRVLGFWSCRVGDLGSIDGPGSRGEGDRSPRMERMGNSSESEREGCKTQLLEGRDVSVNEGEGTGAHRKGMRRALKECRGFCMPSMSHHA